MGMGDWVISEQNRLCHKHPEVKSRLKTVEVLDGSIECWWCGETPPNEILYVAELAECKFDYYDAHFVQNHIMRWREEDGQKN